MTSSVKSQFIVFGAGLTLLVIGTVYAISSYWTPKLKADGLMLAQNKAAITAIQRQQQNLATAARQLSERGNDQTLLNQDLWAFSRENDFYEQWDPLAASTDTKITLDAISNATPGEVPIRREATITIIGQLTNAWRAIQDLQNMKPIVVVQNFQFTPGTKAETVVARVIIATLWYDDTIR